MDPVAARLDHLRPDPVALEWVAVIGQVAPAEATHRVHIVTDDHGRGGDGRDAHVGTRARRVCILSEATPRVVEVLLHAPIRERECISRFPSIHLDDGLGQRAVRTGRRHAHGPGGLRRERILVRRPERDRGHEDRALTGHKLDPADRRLRAGMVPDPQAVAGRVRVTDLGLPHTQLIPGSAMAIEELELAAPHGRERHGAVPPVVGHGHDLDALADGDGLRGSVTQVERVRGLDRTGRRVELGPAVPQPAVRDDHAVGTTIDGNVHDRAPGLQEHESGLVPAGDPEGDPVEGHVPAGWPRVCVEHIDGRGGDGRRCRAARSRPVAPSPSLLPCQVEAALDGREGYWKWTTTYSGTFSSSTRCISRRSRLNVRRAPTSPSGLSAFTDPEGSRQPHVEVHPIEDRDLVALLVVVVADHVDRRLLVAHLVDVDGEVDAGVDDHLRTAREVLRPDRGRSHEVRVPEERGSIRRIEVRPELPRRDHVTAVLEVPAERLHLRGRQEGALGQHEGSIPGQVVGRDPVLAKLPLGKHHDVERLVLLDEAVDRRPEREPLLPALDAPPSRRRSGC